MLMESLSEQNKEKILGYLKSDDLIYKLEKINNIIGRDTNCTIVLNHPSISKQHAKIEYDIQTSNAFLTDLNSTHGTFINNMKLNQNQSIKLKSGDVINFGQSDIKYVYLNYKQRYELGLNDNNNINFGYNIKDDKISLVNENEYENASMNHFNNPNTNSNNKLNSFNYNNLNLNNIDNNEEDNVNIKNYENGINDINNNEEENIDEEINNSQENNYINNNNNNKIIPNKNQMTQIIEESNPDMQSNTLLLSSNNLINQKIKKTNTNQNQTQNPSLYQEIYNKNNLLEIELKSKNNEIKNLTELYNQLQDNYNKLNAKHNALMIYASDIQKKMMF